MRAVAFVATALALACVGCGGAHRSKAPDHRQSTLVARVSGPAAVNIGKAACKDLPSSTLPENGTKQQKLAALRAYLQAQHPNDSIGDMLEGCRAQLHL